MLVIIGTSHPGVSPSRLTQDAQQASWTNSSFNDFHVRCISLNFHILILHKAPSWTMKDGGFKGRCMERSMKKSMEHPRTAMYLRTDRHHRRCHTLINYFAPLSIFFFSKRQFLNIIFRPLFTQAWWKARLILVLLDFGWISVRFAAVRSLTSIIFACLCRHPPNFSSSFC